MGVPNGLGSFSKLDKSSSRPVINITNKIFVKKSKKKSVNPDPRRYKILRSKQVDDFLFVMIKYLDCTNFEGKKILVFEDVVLEDLERQKVIDPHFSNSKKYIHPVARFKPTDIWWNYAISLFTNRE